MKNKSILVIVALCVGLQSGVTFGGQAPAQPQTQGWGSWAYGQAAGAYNAAAGALTPYFARVQRVANEQFNVLLVAARKEANDLAKLVQDIAKRELDAMKADMQRAILSGDTDAAMQILVRGVNNAKMQVEGGARKAAENFQKDMQVIGQDAMNKVMTETQTQTTAAAAA